jgi:hypothetical protein
LFLLNCINNKYYTFNTTMIHDWSSINVVCVLPDVLKWLMKYHCMKVFAMFYNDGMSLNEIVLWYITMVRYPWKYFVIPDNGVISWNEIVLWYFYSKMFLKLVIDSTITKSCISFTILFLTIHSYNISDQ